MPVLPWRSLAGLPRLRCRLLWYDGAGGFLWRTWWGGARVGYHFQSAEPVGWHRLRPTAFSQALTGRPSRGQAPDQVVAMT